MGGTVQQIMDFLRMVFWIQEIEQSHVFSLGIANCVWISTLPRYCHPKNLNWDMRVASNFSLQASLLASWPLLLISGCNLSKLLVAGSLRVHIFGSSSLLYLENTKREVRKVITFWFQMSKMVRAGSRKDVPNTAVTLSLTHFPLKSCIILFLCNWI